VNHLQLLAAGNRLLKTRLKKRTLASVVGEKKDVAVMSMMRRAVGSAEASRLAKEQAKKDVETLVQEVSVVVVIVATAILGFGGPISHPLNDYVQKDQLIALVEDAKRVKDNIENELISKVRDGETGLEEVTRIPPFNCCYYILLCSPC